MKVSRRFKKYILDKLKRFNLRPPPHSEARFTSVPVIIDGVIDWLTWDREKQRYTEIRVDVAREGIMVSDMLPDGTVYADKTEQVIISLD